MLAVGFDIDETLAGSTGVFLQVIEKEYGVKATKEQMLEWHLEKNFPLNPFTKSQLEKIYEKNWENYKNIPLEDPNIPKIMERLSKLFEIHIVTATVGKSDNIKKWLELNGIKFDKFDHVEKSILKIEAKIDILVDDYEKVATICSEHGKKVILLSQPWNRKFCSENTDPKIKVAKDWNEIERILMAEV